MNTAEFLRQVLGLEDSALLAEAETVCRIKTVRKDEYLIEQGQLQEEVFLLVDGICRGFFVNERGQDITDCLVTRCGMPLMASGDLSIPAPIAIQALTNSRVFCMPTAELSRLIDKYPALLGQGEDVSRLLRVHHKGLLAENGFSMEQTKVRVLIMV